MADLVLLAYLAGIIDGEGTIGITEVTRPLGDRRRVNSTFRAYLSITMTEPTIPLLLAETFGGKVRTYPPRREGHKATMCWSIDSGRAAAACEQLLPYLRLKRQQAELVIAFRSRTKDWTTRRMPGTEVSERREYVTKIHALNKRGA
jgi:hypothetical protein